MWIGKGASEEGFWDDRGGRRIRDGRPEVKRMHSYVCIVEGQTVK